MIMPIMLSAALLFQEPAGLILTQTTVCAVRAHPDRYLGKQISIEAEILADGMHGIAYFDPKCKGDGLSHGRPLPDADGSVQTFEDSIVGLEMAQPYRRYGATLCGKLAIDPKTRRASLRLYSISNLKVIPADAPAAF